MPRMDNLPPVGPFHRYVRPEPAPEPEPEYTSPEPYTDYGRALREKLARAGTEHNDSEQSLSASYSAYWAARAAQRYVR